MKNGSTKRPRTTDGRRSEVRAAKPPTPTPTPTAGPEVGIDVKEPERARLIRAIPREPAKEEPKKPQLSPDKTYRVIHGTVWVALDPKTFTRPDGTIDRCKPKQFDARPGDIVWLNDVDAARLLSLDIIELASTPMKESRCGKVFAPPKKLPAAPAAWRSLGGTPAEVGIK